ALVEKVTKGLSNDWDKAEAIKKAISSRCQYDLNAPAIPPNQDAVDYFLFDSKKGYCELFASAMAVMARCAGIKSQYDVGYLVSDQDRDSQGNYRIRENDAHAWASLQFEGLGWITFDATEGSIDVTGQGGLGANSGSIVLLIAGIGLLLAGAGIVYAIKGAFGRKRVYGGQRDRTRKRITNGFESFCISIKRLTNTEKEWGMTVQEYIDIAGPYCGENEQMVREMALEYERMFYGSEPIKRESANIILSRSKSLARALNATKSKKGLVR
ncbi:MAG: transglutaminase-like domain-containing protein, partial [Rhabdochlamydiaceae bacterium]